MPGETYAGPERRITPPPRPSPWLAPAFLAGVIMTGGGFFYSYGVSTANDKRTAEDVLVLRKDFEIRRLEDLKNLGEAISSLRADMNDRAHSDEENRRRMEDALSDMAGHIQRFDDQLKFEAAIKPGRR